MGGTEGAWVLPSQTMKTVQTLFLAIIMYSGLAMHAQAQAAKAKPDPATRLYFSANKLYNLKFYGLAVKEYESFLQKHPTNAKVTLARFGLALSFWLLI